MKKTILYVVTLAVVCFVYGQYAYACGEHGECPHAKDGQCKCKHEEGASGDSHTCPHKMESSEKCKCEKEGDCNCKEGGECKCGESCGCKNEEAVVPKDMIGKKAKCPVSKKEFTIKEDTAFSQYQGEFYFFCCAECKEKFDKEPEKYINKANKSKKAKGK